MTDLAVSISTSADDSFDSLLVAFGLATPVVKPMSREDVFVKDILTGNRCNLMLHFLKCALGEMSFLSKNGVLLQQQTVKRGIPGVYSLSRMEYANIMLRYYLLMAYLPHFQKGVSPTSQVCSMSEVIERIMADAKVRQLINNA